MSGAELRPGGHYGDEGGHVDGHGDGHDHLVTTRAELVPGPLVSSVSPVLRPGQVCQVSGCQTTQADIESELQNYLSSYCQVRILIIN